MNAWSQNAESAKNTLSEDKFEIIQRVWPLEPMGQIISSRCPIVAAQVSSPWEVLLDKLIFLSFFHSLPLSEEKNMHSE